MISKPTSAFIQNFVRFSSDAVFLLNQQDIIADWNEPLEHLTGFISSYAIGKPISELFPVAETADLQQAISDVRAGKESANCHFTVLRADGSSVLCQANLFLVDGNENTESTVAGIIKVTPASLIADKERIEQELLKSKYFAARVAEAAPCIITIYDLRENQHVYFNKQLEFLTGFSLEEVRAYGSSLFEQLIHPDDVQLLQEHISVITKLPDGEVKELEYRVKDKSGNWRWFLVRGSIFSRDASGAATQLLAVFVDIEEPRQSKQLLSNVLSNTQVGLMALEAVHDVAGKISDFTFTLINDKAGQMLSLNPDTIAGQSLVKVLETSGSTSCFENYITVMQTGQPVMFEKHYQSGKNQVWLSVTAARMGKGINVSLTDITNLKKAEIELSESRDFISKITNAIPIVLQVYETATGKVIFSNSELENFSGIDTVGSGSILTPGFQQNFVHPDDINALISYHETVFAGQLPDSDGLRLRIKHRSGNYHWCICRVSVFKAGPGNVPLQGITVIQDIDELKRNKNLLQGVLNQSRNMIIAFESVRDEKGTIVDFKYLHLNATSEKFTGMKPEELVGQSLKKYMTDPAADRRFGWYANVVETGINAEFEEFYNLLIGPTWFHISAVKMGDGFVATFSDVTERKLAENKLSESQQFIKKVTDTAPFIITVYDVAEQKYVFRNRQLASQLGYLPDEVEKMGESELVSLIHPDDLKKVPEHYQKLDALAEGEVAQFRFRAREKGGTYRYMVACDTVFKRNQDGTIAAVLGVSQDVHDLQRNKDLLASVLDSSMSGITVLQAIRDEQGNLTDFTYSLRNLASEQIQEGKVSTTDTFLSKWPFLKNDSLPAQLFTVVETGEPLHLEYYYHQGVQKWLEVYASKLDDGIVLTYTDVSVRKESEDKIRKSEALLSQAQQIANLGVWEWDILSDKITWSDMLYQMFELEPSVKNISLNNYVDLLDEEDGRLIKNLIEKTFETKESFTFPHKISLPDGRIKHVIGKGRLLLSPDNKPLRMLGTVMDITELIEIRQQLSEMLQIKSIGEAIPQIIWTAKPNGFTDFVNQRWYEFTGLEAAKMRSGEWTKLIHPDDAPATWWNWKKSLVSGNVFEMEFRMLRQDGVYRWLLGRAVPMTDESGEIVKWFGASTDIDDQKRTMEEMELIQDALSNYNKELSQKNEELRQINSDLDNFIYTASHDLKAPISNIEGLLNLIKTEVNNDSELSARVFDLMEHSIIRFKNTLKDLADISKADRALNEAATEVHLPELMDEIEADIDALIKESRAIIRFDFRAEDIHFSRKNIRSILYNLLSNALKYRSPDRPSEVLVTSIPVADNFVELNVTDNGLGLDEKDKERVFEMFKRAHSHVEGSGVGLYIVKRIVENAGGKIEVESAVDKGTTFRILLPR